MKRLSLIAIQFGLLVFSLSLAAEPWLASRYAQNCAACHAPGRVNVPPPARRCTLSCQGCHTNPSGGGLRNTYGKWNEERWLNSMYFKDYKLNRPRPLPTREQFYSDDKIKTLTGDRKTKVATLGFNLRETTARLPESEYDRRSTHETFVEPDHELAMARIPEQDPYRLRRQNYLNAGLDLRYFYLDQKTDSVSTKSSFLMGGDVAVSAEPFQGVSMVVESRFLNGPTKPAWDAGFESSSQVRSAYVLVDDLAYNSFFQYGLYRPMFGNYSPDHTTLFSLASGLNQRSVFKVASFGTAPNVPFLNVHWLQPTNSTTFAQDKGYVVNLGARFVSFGAYGMLSYWDSKADSVTANTTTKRNMISATGGGTLGRYIGVFDFTQVTKEKVNVRKDSGLVMTLENRYRVWRENYLKLIYEKLNTATDLQAGSTTAYELGVHSFLVSGLELEMSYRDMTENNTTISLKSKTALAQVHFFF